MLFRKGRVIVLTLRAARPEDLDTILSIIDSARRFMATLEIDQWPDNYPDRTDFETDRALEQSFVLTDKDTILAVCALSERPEADYESLTDGQWLSSNQPYATLHRFAVRTQGDGSAIALLRQLEARCRTRGIRWLRVDTHRGNLVMRRFLEREGFFECGLLRLSEVRSGDPIRVGYEKPL